MIQVCSFMDGLFILEGELVRQFLIVGDTSALLIDTGFQDSHVVETVKSITDLPLDVVISHGDWDHTGGLSDFEQCHLHPADWSLVKQDVCLLPLQEGDVFSCGNYRLEVVEIPGHTYGSIALIDWEKKLMFPGDSVQKDGPIYMFGSHRNLDLYIASQKKLLEFAPKIETIIPCHHPYPIDPSYIQKNLNDAVRLKNRQLQGQSHPSLPCFSYQGQWTEFYYME